MLVKLGFRAGEFVGHQPGSSIHERSCLCLPLSRRIGKYLSRTDCWSLGFRRWRICQSPARLDYSRAKLFRLRGLPGASPAGLEIAPRRAAESAFTEFARFKMSEVSPFWPAIRAVGRTVERNITVIFLFIFLYLYSICF